MIRQSALLSARIAEVLSSLPEEPQPTNFSDRNVVQNALSPAFHASKDLLSSTPSVPARSCPSPDPAAFALSAAYAACDTPPDRQHGREYLGDMSDHVLIPLKALVAAIRRYCEWPLTGRPL